MKNKMENKEVGRKELGKKIFEKVKHVMHEGIMKSKEVFLVSSAVTVIGLGIAGCGDVNNEWKVPDCECGDTRCNVEVNVPDNEQTDAGVINNCNCGDSECNCDVEVNVPDNEQTDAGIVNDSGTEEEKGMCLTGSGNQFILRVGERAKIDADLDTYIYLTDLEQNPQAALIKVVYSNGTEDIFALEEGESKTLQNGIEIEACEVNVGINFIEKSAKLAVDYPVEVCKGIKEKEVETEHVVVATNSITGVEYTQTITTGTITRGDNCESEIIVTYEESTFEPPIETGRDIGDYLCFPGPIYVEIAGETWAVLNTTEDVEFGRESVSGLLNVGDTIDAGTGYKVRIDDVYNENERPVIISVIDTGGNVVCQDQINPCETKDDLCSTGITLHVYMTSPGLSPLSTWADVAILSDTMDLSDGGSVSMGEKEYNVYITRDEQNRVAGWRLELRE